MPPSLSLSVKILTAACLTSLLALPAAVSAPTANAASYPRYERSLNQTVSIWLADIKTCVVAKSTGTAKFAIAPFGSASQKYIDRVVSAPKLDIHTYDKCGKGRKAKKLAKLTVTQAIHSSTCSVGVGIGVGFPWSVSVSGSIQCGQVKSARRSSTYGSGTHFVQSNSSNSISIGNEGLGFNGNPYRKTWTRPGGTHYYSLPVPIELSVVAYSSKTRSDSGRAVFKHSVSP